MATQQNPPENEPPPQSDGGESLVSFYSSYLFNRIRSLLPNVSITSSNNFISKLTNSYGSSKRRRRKTCLALPLPPSADQPSKIPNEARRIFEVLEDIIEHALLNLHVIQNNLLFWQSKAKGSSAQMALFMLCERGPYPFVDGTVQLVRDCISDGSGMQKLYSSASSHISERISVLTSLRFSLATFLAEVYVEVDRIGEDLIKNAENVLPSLLVSINDLFSKLESSIGHFHANCQSGSTVDGTYSVPLMFAKLPEVNQEGSQWTECEITDAINLIHQNLSRLDSYLSAIVSKHRKPRKITLYWMHYSCGALGLSILSLWLLRHSKYMGSSDIDNWILEAKESTSNFWNDHVEQPILAIRDELFETFKKRKKGAMEREEMQLTADTLRRMLFAFTEQTLSRKFPESASDQEMLEVVMQRYEKEIMHPIQGFVGGELVRIFLIQIQKLKLDVEEAMLELDQILRANEINFAILAALPAFLVSLILATLVRAWLKQDTRAEGRGRAARIQRRLLLVEIDRAIMQFQKCKDEGFENDAQCMYGFLLYFLDCLHSTVEGHAKSTGEWICLSQDIIDMSKPSLQTESKLHIASRMEGYDCLLPSSRRQ